MSIGRKHRKRGIALLATASTALAGLTLVPGSAAADPKPTLPEAKAKVAELQHKAEVAGEDANDLRDDIATARRRLTAISTGVAKQQRQVDAIREQIGSLAVAGYQQAGISTTAQLLLSENPEQFLDQASTAQAFAGQQSAALRRFQGAQGKLGDLQAAEQTELAGLQAVQAKQDGLKKQLDKHLEEAEKVLGRLSEAERDRLEAEEDAEEEKARKNRPSRSDRDDDPDDLPGSGRGIIALNYALDQIGDPYSWGADGPSSFDCSGLTMTAWGKAGVSLSHSSRAQTNEGRSVSRSNLRPGDLVFFYSPVSHVGIYYRDGKMVDAPRPGKSVRITDIDSMPYSGAVRPG